MSGIALSPSLLQDLDNLSQTQGEYDTVQRQLGTGLAVYDPTDNAVAYFRAASLTGRATQVLNYKGGIDQGVSSIDTALTATTAVENLLQQLQGMVEGARGASLPARTEATQQFKAIGTQLNQLVQDAAYQGLNLLSSTAAQLTVQFGPQNGGGLTIAGYDLTATGAGNARALFTAVGAFNTSRAILFSNVVAGGTVAVQGFSALDVTGGAGTVAASLAATIFDEAKSRLNNAITQLQSVAGSLGSFAGVLQTRSVFQQSYATQLRAGARKLTLADLNTSAAESEAASLRIALGLQSAALQGQLRSTILQILHSSAASQH
ncbi:hypothetical protein GCM10011611_14380 [Aliidongia dinghuensis]|uniref:Flagellin N-terminal domain-containing protein n=1 Tax=Aliidongia dinghuensis TaxID=1867774 RepID=A0A8J2YR52_9PROT|nr:hypothetical protein [Aliidongia dinghuensis]GGF09968.1 hypothetical protein GCM10011611_14380 [Aliidongia dinghuensis]